MINAGCLADERRFEAGAKMSAGRAIGDALVPSDTLDSHDKRTDRRAVNVEADAPIL